MQQSVEVATFDDEGNLVVCKTVDYRTQVYWAVKPTFKHLYRDGPTPYDKVRFFRVVARNVAEKLKKRFNIDGLRYDPMDLDEIEELMFLEKRTGIMFVANNTVDPDFVSDCYVYFTEGQTEGRTKIKSYFRKLPSVTLNQVCERLDKAVTAAAENIIHRSISIQAFRQGTIDQLLPKYVIGAIKFVLNDRSDLLDNWDDFRGVIMIPEYLIRNVFVLPLFINRLAVVETGHPDSPALCWKNLSTKGWYLLLSSMYKAENYIDEVEVVEFEQ